MSDDARSRAAARRDWPGQVRDLTTAAGEDLSAETTAEERLSMMWELALRAWTLSGRTLPDYARSAMPGSVTRPE